jgi:hypothetical protein
MVDPTDNVSGTVVRAPDGSLYFISDDLLEKLRIPDEHADPLEDALEQGGSEKFSYSEQDIKVARVEGTIGDIFAEGWEVELGPGGLV